MLKKLCVIFSILILFCGWTVSTEKPVFSAYADSFEVYVNDASSLAGVVSVTEKEFFRLKNVVGESVELDKNGFNLEEFLLAFKATVLFEESTDSVISYYAYSPLIRYQKKINGQNVNLHVAVSNSRVKAGAPLIFGSF